MSSDSSLWHRVGYALEQARQLPGAGKKKLTALTERDTHDRSSDPGRASDGADQKASDFPTDHLLTTGAVALVTRALDAWRPGPRSSVAAMARAGAAGAVAALLVEVARPLLRSDASRPDLGPRTPEHMLTGVGQGLVYGAVVEPWLPGPPLLKGALYGSAEYALESAGGLTRILGRRSPLGRVPFMLKLLDGLESDDRHILEHVTFGMAVGVLYGLSRSSSGMRADD